MRIGHGAVIMWFAHLQDAALYHDLHPVQWDASDVIHGILEHRCWLIRVEFYVVDFSGVFYMNF